MVVDVATVAEGVGFAESGCHGAGGGLERAPCVVDVIDDGSAGGVDDFDYITLYIGNVVIGSTVIADGHGRAGSIIGKVPRYEELFREVELCFTS